MAKKSCSHTVDLEVLAYLDHYINSFNVMQCNETCGKFVSESFPPVELLQHAGLTAMSMAHVQ